MGISDAPFYNWKKKYGGLGPSEVRRLKQLEEENTKLKKLVIHTSIIQSASVGQARATVSMVLLYISFD